MDSIMVLDVGNSNTKIGIFVGPSLAHHWRISTVQERTTDELGMVIAGLVQSAGVVRNQLAGVVISSVVPPIMPAIERMCKQYFGITPLIVGPGVRTGLDIKADSPREVGVDRIVNAISAVAQYGPPLIIVDFGTATTFCVVDALGHYVGGAIAPGVRTSADALFESAAKLPRVELARPKTVIGKNTVTGVQSGVVYGFASLVDGMVEHIARELPLPYTVVATGGLAELIAPESKCISHIHPLLTLEGLRIVWERNRER